MESILRVIIRKYNKIIPMWFIKLLRFFRAFKLKILEFNSKIYFFLNINNYQKRLFRKLYKKSQITVVFIINDISLWKLEPLYKLFDNSDKYEPIIVLSNFIFLPSTEKNENFQLMLSYFKSKGFRLYDGSNNNYKYQRSFKKRLRPEIVIFTSPYEVFDAEFLCQTNLDSLKIYTQYAYNLTEIKSLVDNYTNKFVDLNFVEHEFIEEFNNKIINREFKVTGYIEADGIEFDSDFSHNRDFSKNRIRILYAPHHFDSSSFWSFGAEIINSIIANENEFELFFKPHPLLKSQLMKKSLEEINFVALLQKWETELEDLIWGKDNAALFNFVDVIVHDSYSFLAVSLYSGKPAFFLLDSENGHEEILNDFGRLCLEQHYILQSDIDLEQILNDLKENNFNDYKRENRVKFYNDYLSKNHGKAADNVFAIIDDFINTLK